MAHMQIVSDVGRWDDNGEGLRPCPLGASGLECRRLLPNRCYARLDGGGIKCFFHHDKSPVAMRAKVCATKPKRGALVKSFGKASFARNLPGFWELSEVGFVV